MGRLAIAVLRVLLGLILFGCAIAQLWFFPTLAAQLVEAYPELEWLRWPMLGLVWLIILGAQVGLVAVWVLLGMVQHDRVFTAGAFRWVDVIIVAAVIDTLLVLSVFVLLSFVVNANPPALLLTQVALILGGAAFALLMTVMKRLLRQASQLTDELSVVI